MNLTFNLDVDRVQSSVQASIRPAVESALKSIDIEKKIKEALIKTKSNDDSIFGMMYGRKRDTMINEMIYDGIKEIAKQYVTVALKEQKASIHAALAKMIAADPDRIVKRFSKAIDETLDGDWGFSMDVKVSPTKGSDDA